MRFPVIMTVLMMGAILQVGCREEAERKGPPEARTFVVITTAGVDDVKTGADSAAKAIDQEANCATTVQVVSAGDAAGQVKELESIAASHTCTPPCAVMRKLLRFQRE